MAGEGNKTPFQMTMDKQSNLIPRMGPVVKHELYFPQCYAPPFNQAFGVQQQPHSGSAAPTPSAVPPPAVVQWHIASPFGFREYVKVTEDYAR